MTEFAIQDDFTITGRTGYAMEALAAAKANPGKVLRFRHTSPNAAGRLRTLGLTTKSSQAKDEQGNFQYVDLEVQYNADSKEALAAAHLAANPKPKAPGKPKAKKAKS